MESNGARLQAAVESLAEQFTVNEVTSTGNVVLEPDLTVQEAMTKQIGQLWEQHVNFQGLSDSDSDISMVGEKDEQATSTAEMDAYGVRYAVHEQLRVAQSEIQVSLDLVRLLLAAKRRVAREVSRKVALAQQSTEQLHELDQAKEQAGDVEVTVGGLPFPVDMLSATRVDATNAAGQQQQQKRREDEIRFVLGAKQKQLAEAADTLESCSQRLQQMARGEARFWQTAFELRRRNWTVAHQRQMPGMQRVPGDRYFVRFGYGDSGSAFSDDAVAELLRSDTDGDEDAAADVAEPTPLYVPKNDGRLLAVRLAVAGQGGQRQVLGGSRANDTEGISDCSAYDRLHLRLLSARNELFDRELFQRLSREARLLELGAVRTMERNADVLVAALSRDDAGVRFEWALQKQPEDGCAGGGFAQWQGRFYAGMARVMAALCQRRAHRAAKLFQLGEGLTSHTTLALSAAAGPRDRAVPEAFAGGGHDEAGDGAAAVARADLLVLSPVLQSVQFAKWQHILTGSVRRACGAWRRLVNEPIEVVSHLARTFQIPVEGQAELSTNEKQANALAFVIRMRFQGGTVMAFWLDSWGRLFFVKGFYPPMTKFFSEHKQQQQQRNEAAVMGLRQEESLIRRVFRVVPLGGVGDFRDQLRRELQSLVLLRAAAALTRCSRSREDGLWRMGQWHVHQSQMCVVGELWQGARQRQIVGVARWHAPPAATARQDCPAVELSGANDDWDLSLYFGPKHPTSADLPRSLAGPWVTCYPPPNQPSNTNSFEENLLQVLENAL
ncbi:hypothetical protein EV183_002623 [Coemansia sp. RSA 2336]|nr:hypothetical protein EV183_002623 [Coemansia sp. RSA 2336]